MDEKGRLFGKINIIDLIVCIMLIFGIIAVYKAVKIFRWSENETMRKNAELRERYLKTFPCPNCGGEIDAWFDAGTLIPDTYPTVCPICKNHVVVVVRSPKPTAPPEPALTYQEQYYKYLLNNGR